MRTKILVIASVCCVLGGLSSFAVSAVSSTETFGGTAIDRCYGLTKTADGGFVLAGETASMGAGAEDVYAVKTDRRRQRLLRQ